MTSRREVRVAESFFEELDLQLSAERGPLGEPSATDFLVVDLPVIVDRFASGFDELQEAVEGVPAARMFIGSGATARAFVVHGVETVPGVVELIAVEIDSG